MQLEFLNNSKTLKGQILFIHLITDVQISVAAHSRALGKVADEGQVKAKQTRGLALIKCSNQRTL